MNINRKILVVLSVAIMIGVFIAAYFPHDQYTNKNSRLRVGSGQDITGVLLEEISKTALNLGDEQIFSSNNDESEKASLIDTYMFVDCCANASQWALISQDIEAGFFCSHTALHMVNQNHDFEIYGPVVMNAEVVASCEAPEYITSIGVPQKRRHLQELIAENYPGVTNTVEMNPASISYAIKSGQVNGAIIDVSHMAQLDTYTFYDLTDTDYVSFCLVVRKDIIETKSFQDFVYYYNETVTRLSEEGALASLLSNGTATLPNVRVKLLHL